MMEIHIETNPLHPATGLCVQALAWLHERAPVANALEIGCGNGILSLAAAGLWKAPVLAVDIAQQAVEDTRAASIGHGLSQYITALRSDGFSAPEIRARAPYDLIICNFLAEPIIRMAPDMASHVAPGGVCILSGIRLWEAEAALEPYRQRGFELFHSLSAAPWVTYLMRGPV